MADGSVVINSQMNNTQVNQGIQDLETRIRGLGDKMKGVGETLTKSVTVPLTAMGVAGVAAATQVGSAQTKIQNSLGLTAEETKELTNVAKGIYKDGFGESLEEVGDALIRTKQNIQGLDDQELENVTKSAMNLAQTFDSDVNEVTRAGDNLINTFGISAEEAFDLMASGAQKGLNFSNEMFDNLSEYAPLFNTMGFSASEYFQLLEQGSQAGIYNLDYINDVMKEFQIRVKDGSKATSDAMAMLSEDTNKVWESYLKGEATVKDVHNAVIGELKSMDDQVLANQIGVGLYGTKFEDLEADAMYALGNIEGGMQGVNGAMDEMNKVSEESFGQKWKAFSREALLALEPLGKVLLDFASAVLPSISKAIATVSEAFGSLSPTTQTIIVAIGAVAAAIGPLLVVFGSIAGAVANLIPIITKLGPVFTVLRTAITALTGPIGIVIAIVTTLGLIIFKNWDAISQKTVEIFSAIGTFLSEGWTKIQQKAEEIFSAIGTFFSTWWGNVKTDFTEKLNSIKTTISNAWNNVKNKTSSILSSMRTAISEKFNSFKTAVSGKMNEVKSKVSEIWNKVMGFFKNINLVSIGKNIIQGLIDGIKAKVSAVANAVKSVTSAITGKIKSILNIHSPSRWMRDMIGKNMMLGWQIGIEKEQPRMEKTAEEMTQWATPKIPDITSLIPSVTGIAEAFKMAQIAPSINMPNSLTNSPNGETIQIELSIPLDGEVIARKTVKFTSRELYSMMRSSNRGSGRK